MFPRSYFGGRYFPPEYFGQSTAHPIIASLLLDIIAVYPALSGHPISETAVAGTPANYVEIVATPKVNRWLPQQ